MPAPRIIGLPALYVQGEDILCDLPERLVDYFACTQAVVVCDPVVKHLFTGLVCPAHLALQILDFGGQCTRAEVQRLSRLASTTGPEVVVGAGGGQALDTAKAVALALNLPLVIVPTAASSDAPTSRLIAIYDEAHKITEVPLTRRNPDLIFVDTGILVRAPRRLFIAGMGDAFTKRYEVADAARDPEHGNYFGGRPPHLATVLASACHDALLHSGPQALSELDAGVAGPNFERVVEASILYSGLAFESGGLSVAHGMLRGLTACAQTHASLHGELVSYGLLVQLHAFGWSNAEIAQASAFLAAVGLPTSRRDIGLAEANAAQLLQIAELTLSAPYLQRLAPTLNAARLVQAMAAVEEFAATKNHLKETQR